jgi:hypothetical protein
VSGGKLGLQGDQPHQSLEGAELIRAWSAADRPARWTTSGEAESRQFGNPGSTPHDAACLPPRAIDEDEAGATLAPPFEVAALDRRRSDRWEQEPAFFVLGTEQAR